MTIDRNADRWWTILSIAAAALLVWSEPIAAELSEYAPPPAGSVRIVRDKYGVPHVIAAEERALFYGVGYVQAEDQAANVARNFLRGRGRVAEVVGAEELVNDHLVRMMQIPQQAQRQYAKLSGAGKLAIDSFVDGFNAYRQANLDKLPSWIEPARPEDILGFYLYTELMFTISHCREDMRRANITASPLSAGTSQGANPQWWVDLDRVRMADHRQSAQFGSNQFAIAPKRSTAGAALLSMDPHLPLSGFFRWYEMHLVGPGINMMGACFFGSPYVTMGRNEHSAWCMTVNAPDLGDVFGFTINPENPRQYRDIDGWKEFDDTMEVYRLRNGDKTVERKFPCRRTSLGPVVAVKQGVAYVLVLPWSETADRIDQIRSMGVAKNVVEFKKSLEPLGLVMFNLVYADVHGDIFYISNARLPRRDLRITSHDVRPGHESWARWQGFHTIDELPQVLNPPCGYLLNTNSGPHNVCPDVAPQEKDFVPYMMGQFANSRWKRLSALLAADSQISLDEVQSYATDTYLLAADEWVPRLVKTLEAIDSQHPQKQLASEAARVLEQWDRRTDVGSRGAVLFVRLVSNREILKAKDADVQKLSAELATAIVNELTATKELVGALDAPWGNFSRIRRGDLEVAVAGCGFTEPHLNPFIALRPTTSRPSRGKREAAGGSSYGMIVDFSKGMSAASCLPFGVSDVPSSPHFADHLPLYAQAKYKPAWFDAKDVEANRLSDKVLQVPSGDSAKP
jgi:acyl-homoserine lactone acylase PvdQ